MSVVLSDDLRDRLTLHLVSGLGPRRMAALLERFGSPASILAAAEGELRQVSYIGQDLARRISRARNDANVEAEITLLNHHNVHLRAFGSPDYPQPLATIFDPPPLLYARGTLEEGDRRAVGIVGTRGCTDYGKRTAARLAGELVRAGYTVVSGLARGIDAAAHRGALQAGGRTIAVLAGGLSRIYPPEHRELAGEVEKAGALVAEATMTQEPIPSMFPARNRIISGLSRAVVVVEADERSGALITAKLAADQSRTVFAVPGPVDSPASRGCHSLLRDGAILCRTADDVLEELEGISQRANQEVIPPGPPPAPLPAEPPPWLDETQRKVWDFLADGPHHVDEMVQVLEVPAPRLSGLLLTMEMKKAVRRLPGNRYERC